MKELRIKVQSPQGEKSCVGIAWRGPGPFLLADIAKAVTGFYDTLAAIERNMTGKRTAKIKWEIVECILQDIPQEAQPK